MQKLYLPILHCRKTIFSVFFRYYHTTTNNKGDNLHSRYLLYYFLLKKSAILSLCTHAVCIAFYFFHQSLKYCTRTYFYELFPVPLFFGLLFRLSVFVSLSAVFPGGPALPFLSIFPSMDSLTQSHDFGNYLPIDGSQSTSPMQIFHPYPDSSFPCLLGVSGMLKLCMPMMELLGVPLAQIWCFSFSILPAEVEMLQSSCLRGQHLFF